MSTIADAYAQARKHHQAGEFRQAEGIYQQILAVDPGNAQTWFLLGTAYQSQAKLGQALHAFQQAVWLKPQYAEAHTHLGMVQAELGRFEDAVTNLFQTVRQHPEDADARYYLGSALAAMGKLDQAIVNFEQGLRSRPDHVDAHTSLGISLARSGRLVEAVACLQQALRLRPDYAKAHNNLGVALAELGRHEEAAGAWQEALRHKPDYAEAHFNLAVTLAERGQTEDALAGYQRTIQLKPDHAEAHNNLGLGLIDKARPAEAIMILKQALRLRSDYAEAHNNLGLALVDLGRFDEALGHYEQALRLRPAYAEAHNNLGTALAAMARTEEALVAYQQSLWLKPDYAEVHWNRALAYLQTGRYQEGWHDYEWRWRRKRARPRSFKTQLWDAGPLEGKTILLYAEQGLGDAIQFVRYAPLVKVRGACVILECPPETVALFSTCAGIDRVVTEGSELPPFDVQAPLMSLPWLMGTTLQSVPAPVPYLHPPADLIDKWRQELAPAPTMKIGIAWQGNPRHRWDRHRSFPLALFAPLAAIPGVQLVNLQKGPGTDQVKALEGRFAVLDLAARLDEDGRAFHDTAAVMKSLDLVITCDSALGHLAGALDVPVWIALSFMVDWRWMFERSDTPWYPSARLYRQEKLGTWAPVFERMARDLQAMMDGRLVKAKQGVAASGGPHPSSLSVPVSPGELMDKLTILRIKSKRINNKTKLRNVRTELKQLEQAAAQLGKNPGLDALVGQLQTVNETLWDLENAIRACEQNGDFGPAFLQSARAIYQANDRRAELKRKLNDLLGSDLREEKEYGG